MPNRPTEHSLTLTVDEAAALIGVSRSTAYDLVATDELPTVRLRRRILVPASALADILGVSLVEVYGALNRLRGRTVAPPRRPAGEGSTSRTDRARATSEDRVPRPSPSAIDEPQLW